MRTIIRPLTLADLDELKEIHAAHFEQDFPFPNFTFEPFLGSFVVVDENNKIICGGGVRTFAESVLITDSNRSVKLRRDALLKVLNISAQLCKITGYETLSAFPKDPSWTRILKKYGFVDQVGDALQLDIR